MLQDLPTRRQLHDQKGQDPQEAKVRSHQTHGALQGQTRGGQSPKIRERHQSLRVNKALFLHLNSSRLTLDLGTRLFNL